jgi:hypothetical protein
MDFLDSRFVERIRARPSVCEPDKTVRKEKSLKESAGAHPPSAENRVTVEATASPPTVEAHPADAAIHYPKGDDAPTAKRSGTDRLGSKGMYGR